MRYPKVRAFFDPATATWSYVVWSDTQNIKECAIIDSVLNYNPYSCKTSTETCDAIAAFITSKDLTVQWILETHIHADHMTGAHYLKEQLGGKTAISKHILDVIATWTPFFPFGDIPQDGSQFDHLFEDDEKFTIGDLQAHIIHTPGHTPADTSYIIEGSVFVGDAMFLQDVGSGRCDFPGGSASDSYDSSRRLFLLDDDIRMYVGHDYPAEGVRTAQCMTTIRDQKTANIRMQLGISKEAFISARNADDQGKEVPPLLLPSLQVNLRCGSFGKVTDGIQFISLPVNKL